MTHSGIKLVCLIGIASAAAVLNAGAASAVDYPNKMEGKAKIACGFEADLVFGRKMELASQYVTDNYISHHAVGAPTTDMVTWRDGLAKAPKFNGPAEGCGGAKVVITQGDYVVFLRETMVNDPKNPGQKVPGTHFDIWRFEGNKIAEHWD